MLPKIFWGSYKATVHDWTIPHTLNETVLGHASIGTEVNLETDITGRYIRHFMTLDAPTHTSKSQKSMESLLVENGFM